MDSYITNDLSFAAYLLMNGHKLLFAKRMGKSYKFEFESSSNITQLKLEFPRSEAAKFDAAVRNVKRIVFGDSGSII